MVYSTRRFVVCLSLCHFVLVFLVLLVLRLPRLRTRELILVLFVRLFDLCLFGFVGFSSSWGLGRAAVCDCGTPWTFLLIVFLKKLSLLKTVYRKARATRECCFVHLPASFEMTRELLYLYPVIYSMVIRLLFADETMQGLRLVRTFAVQTSQAL